MKKIVVGLGNPGSRYEKTRHNIGWMVLDRLAERAGSVGRVKAKDAAATARGRIGETEYVLVKPTTYMNLSGQAVRKVLARERVPMIDLLVVVDDMALPFGRLRIKAQGSAGGHNGLRSIIAEMETDGFARLRVGIGAPEKGAVEHVLGDFASAEQRDLDRILDAAADAVTLWANEGTEMTAATWNGWKPDLAEAATAPIVGQPEPRGVSAKKEPPAHATDADGVVRTNTGWRKLLPAALRGRDKSERQ